MAQAQTNLEVTIEKLIYGGDGLARVNGQVALAPFVLPGERAAVEVIEQKRGLLRAKLVEVRESAAERVIPRPGCGTRRDETVPRQASLNDTEPVASAIRRALGLKTAG